MSLNSSWVLTTPASAILTTRDVEGQGRLVVLAVDVARVAAEAGQDQQGSVGPSSTRRMLAEVRDERRSWLCRFVEKEGDVRAQLRATSTSVFSGRSSSKSRLAAMRHAAASLEPRPARPDRDALVIETFADRSRPAIAESLPVARRVRSSLGSQPMGDRLARRRPSGVRVWSRRLW